MKTLLAIVLLTFVVVPLHADADLDRLRGIYESAVTKAVAPIKEGYAVQLKQLADLRRKAGRVEDAQNIELELNRIGGPGGPVIKTPAPKDIPITQEAMEKFFINKTWVSVGGFLFKLAKNGQGTRQAVNEKETPVTWTYLPEGMLQVVAVGSTGQTKVLYFRFVSHTEAFYADNMEFTPALKLTKK